MLARTSKDTKMNRGLFFIKIFLHRRVQLGKNGELGKVYEMQSPPFIYL